MSVDRGIEDHTLPHILGRGILSSNKNLPNADTLPYVIEGA